MYFWRYVGALLLLVLIFVPIGRSHTQQYAIEQDLYGIRLDYGLIGKEKFRARLDDILRRHRVDPEEALIRLKENSRESTVEIGIRYKSPMSFFTSRTRDVIIEKRIILRPVE